MKLIFLWSSFIIFVSNFEELTQLSYFLTSLFMLCLIYFQHKFRPTKILFRSGLLLCNIPLSLLWYLIFVYNDFLSLNPVSYEFLVSMYLVYIYILGYLYWKFPQRKRS